MDIFMSSIEFIANKKKKMYSLREDLPEKLGLRVWDDAVANLTLLCLGTSAPEIFLSTIEVIGHNFDAGFIGPGAIVGSAAANLIIIAFCNIALETGTVRKVFCFTGVFSVFSFFWLYFILNVRTQGVIELWEAILTLSFYPLFVICAYIVNKKITLRGSWAHRLRGDEGDKAIAEATFFKNGVLDKQSLLLFLREVNNYPGITMQEAAVLAAAKLVESEPHSMLWYRMGGIRTLSSGRPLTQRLDKHLKEVLKIMSEDKLFRESWTVMRTSIYDPNIATVEFAAATVAVNETVGEFTVHINRFGTMDCLASVRVQSMDGSAKHLEDYIPINEIITFGIRQDSAQVKVTIINERKYEPTEEFFLRLTPAYAAGTQAKIGKISIMEIKIIHDESPGVIQFEKRVIIVNETVEVVTLYLERFDGSDGEVSVHWKTVDGTAIGGLDYEGGEGVVKFMHSEVRRFLMVQIMNTMAEEKDVRFNVEIFNPTDGAILGDIKRTTVIITDADDVLDFLDKVMTLTALKLTKLSAQRDNWCKQIKEAMMVNGGDEDATNMEYFLHFLSFFWKVLFSLIPPLGLLGGYLQFFTSMLLIALMATLIGDMASIFGCVVGMEDSLTALVLVGVGTSLPDVFACWIVMKHSKTADEAIGNINGTCAVNVFVGLGLPWTLASINKAIKGTELKVNPEGFAPTVLVYGFFCLLTFIFLVFRRQSKFFGNSEVGGPQKGRYLTAFIMIFSYTFYTTFAFLNIQRIVDLK